MEYHAGRIYAAAGDKAKASEHLERALAINPHFHVLFAPQTQKMVAPLKAQTQTTVGMDAGSEHANQN
jgi:hypothetical protein